MKNSKTIKYTIQIGEGEHFEKRQITIPANASTKEAVENKHAGTYKIGSKVANV